MGPRRSHVLTRPLVPEVWLVMVGTNLTSSEVILFEEPRFCLQERAALSPRRLFMSSNLFEMVDGPTQDLPMLINLYVFRMGRVFGEMKRLLWMTTTINGRVLET